MSTAFVHAHALSISLRAHHTHRVCARPTLRTSAFAGRPLHARHCGAAQLQAAGGAPRMAATETEPDKKPTSKELVKLYGGTYLATSVGISMLSFGCFYLLVSAGVDVSKLTNAVADLLSKTPIGRPTILDNISDSAGTVAVAYLAHKATGPIRFPLTIAVTPFVARFFAKKGDDGKAP